MAATELKEKTETQGAPLPFRRGVTVVLPTYREAANLPLVVPDIYEALHDRPLEILIVDDDSPDNTWDEVDTLSRLGYPARLWIRYHEKGLASAIFEGIRLASYDHVIVMDADGQHPPELLPAMADALDKCELVAATRRSEGGDDSSFTLSRRLISWGSNLLAMPLCPQTDRTGGYFGLRRSILDGVSLDAIGWKAGLEIFCKARYSSYTELPFEFGERIHGESKASLRHGLAYLGHLAKLYSHKFCLSQLAKFCIVGGSGVVVNLGIQASLVEGAGAYYLIAAAFGIGASMLSNFTLNKLWTFRDKHKADNTRRYVAPQIQREVA